MRIPVYCLSFQSYSNFHWAGITGPRYSPVHEERTAFSTICWVDSQGQGEAMLLELFSKFALAIFSKFSLTWKQGENTLRSSAI